MNYAIRAWRDTTGTAGITVGTVFSVGYENHVAEVDLSEQEAERFLADCVAALQRAREATGLYREPMPGAYEAWPDA